MYSRHHISQSAQRAARAGCGVLLSACVLSSASVAGDWTITPSIDVEQSFTDNARSVAEGEQSDMITTTTAGVDVVGVGRRVQLNFNYNLSRDMFWDNTDLSGFRQSLLGAGNVEAVEDFVFIDARATITQQSLARNGGESASERNVATNDQSTVVNYSLTPNFAHRYGNWAESDLRVSFNETRFLATDVGEAGNQPDASRSYAITGLVRSGPKFTRTQWELLTRRTFTNNDSNSDLTELSGEYAWSRKLALLGRIGQEKIENSGFNAEDERELFYRGGFRLTPGPRTTIRVETGHRFNSVNYSGDASYQFSSRLSIRATYEEEVQTDRQALTESLNNLIVGDDGQLIDPDTGLPAAPNDSELDFLDQTTRQQTLTLAVNGASGRNTFNVTARADKRTQEPEDTEDTVVSLSGNISRRIRPDLDGGISGNLSVVTESASGIEDITFNGNAFLTYRLMEDFTGSLRYDYLRRDSDNNAQDLEENVVSVSIRKIF